MGPLLRVVYNGVAMDPPVTTMIVCPTALWLVFNRCSAPYQLSGVITTVLRGARPNWAPQCSKNAFAEHKPFFYVLVWRDTDIGNMTVIVADFYKLISNFVH